MGIKTDWVRVVFLLSNTVYFSFINTSKESKRHS